MKPRKILLQLEHAIKKREKKIVFLWGTRQTGKSTILNHMYQDMGGSYFNFDNIEDQRLFVPELTKLISSVQFKNSTKDSPYIFIDEVQRYPEVTQSLKLLADNTDFIILATGSSEMQAKTHNFDTLAGRYKEFVLFPLTIDEVSAFKDESVELTNNPSYAVSQHLISFMDEMMIYGTYPGVVLADQKSKIEDLRNITQNSVVKDIVNIYELRNTDLVFNLLRLLAMQIGNLINVTELASSLGSTKTTIDNYLSILSKNRIIYLLEPFKTNKRRGYLERKKVFFTDLGIRNSLIEDFRPMHLRQDLGAVFENLIVMGFLRQTFYQRNNNKLFYFREIAGKQKEIDLIIESPIGSKFAYEVKYNGGNSKQFPDLGISSYETLSRDNAPKYLV